MKTVAVIGASNDRAKYGNKAVRAFLQRGYEVYPVNPNEVDVEGIPAFQTIMDVPSRPGIVPVYVPPNILLTLLPEIAAKGCDQLFLNPGADSPEVLAEAREFSLPVVQACSILAIGVSPSSL